MKSQTRKALSVSLVLHAWILGILVHFLLQNQPTPPDKAGLTAELLSVKTAARPVPPPRKIVPRFLTTEPVRAEPAETLSAAPTPILADTAPVRPTLGRETASAALDLSTENWESVSTAARTLGAGNPNLSETETASPAGGAAFGTKRSGGPRLQRAAEPSTLSIVAEERTFSPAQLAEMRENRKTLPRVSFGRTMRTLAEEIAEASGGGPIDVVFVIDASGSMGDNIRAVVEHLREMVDVYKASGINYALGVTEFWARRQSNVIKVEQLTRSYAECHRMLQAIGTYRDENALDAVVQTVRELQFRQTSQRHFILVTDEPFTSREGLTVADTIAYCREFDIHVNVLGMALNEHRQLAVETGGKWHVIPEDTAPQQPAPPRQPSNPRTVAERLRHATWNDVKKIGRHMLLHGSQTPLDVVLFIDSSASMEAKLPDFLTQLDILFRDLDNGLVDYRIGAVRFRARASVNIVNVFNPPQTLDQIRKIVTLPCRENEMLLDAVSEGLRRLELRPDAQPYFILITDEPATGEFSGAAVTQLLRQHNVLVSAIGTYDGFQHHVTRETGGVWIPIPEGHTKNNPYW